MSSTFKSGEEYRRQKELEEARKAGLAPAEVDEDGKEINPHIPQYMTNAPWYLNNNHPTLKHQKDWRNKVEDSKQWYDRGKKVFQATKWRKGACENCGSMSHTTKDCLERPRVKGARWTNKNIAADEKIEDIQLANYDSKRDRWNGYDPKEYEKVIERYEKVDEVRRQTKQREQVEKMYKGQASEGGEVADEDVRIDESEDAAFGEVKKRVRTTAGGASGSVRNLRIREDTAKYLLNLDLNSAHYDPKSRSMREDPVPNKPMSEKTFAGDNFVRKNGDFEAWQALNLHSMQAYEKGQDVHLQALPSLAEALHKQFKQKKETLQKKTGEQVLEQYGNLARPPEEDALLLGQTEHYVEYDRMGRVVKGQEVKAKSRYEEDVYLNNHTSVWGSWWKDGVWGYACCHSTVKKSYCVGQTGEGAEAAAKEQLQKNMDRIQQAAEKPSEAGAVTDGGGDQKSRSLEMKGYSSGVWGDELPEGLVLDEEKVRAAMRRHDEGERNVETDERKRGYNSLGGMHDGVTAEDMEAYRLKKQRADDPLQMMKKAGTVGYDLL